MSVGSAGFTGKFTYQDVGGLGADGATFMLLPSTASLNSIGAAGGGFGYLNIPGNSAAYEMNIYNGGY